MHECKRTDRPTGAVCLCVCVGASPEHSLFEIEEPRSGKKCVVLCECLCVCEIFSYLSFWLLGNVVECRNAFPAIPFVTDDLMDAGGFAEGKCPSTVFAYFTSHIFKYCTFLLVHFAFVVCCCLGAQLCVCELTSELPVPCRGTLFG